MKFHNFVATFISFYAITALIDMEKAQAEETTTEKDSNQTERPIEPYCKKWSQGRYVKAVSYTCCRNSTLRTLHHPFDRNGKDVYEKCALQMNKTDTDDLPTATWREYICITKMNGANDESLKTFRGYLNFITRNYTEPFKSEIVNAAVEKCKDGDAEKDEIKRMEMFQTCLYRIERKVCHRPSENLKASPPSSHERTQYCKPEEDFPSNSDSCCKGKTLPYSSYWNFGKSLEYNPNFTELRKCNEHFIRRQKELNPNVYTIRELYDKNQTFDRTKLVDDCWCLCYFNWIPNKPTDYELKIDMEKIHSKMFKPFSKSTRIDFLKLVDKYINENNYVMDDNSTVSITETAKLMESKDELTRISFYCRVHKYITIHFVMGSFKEVR